MHDVNSAISPLSPEGARRSSARTRRSPTSRSSSASAPANSPRSRRKRSSTPAEPAEAAGLETSIGAYVGQQLSKPDTGVSDAIGIAAAIVILLFAFGTATAMMLPIVSAIIGLACSLSIIRLLEHVLEVPSVAATLATMIGLGVGIDYALFIVTRHKLQLGEGMELRESIARATATAGGAVVFAGFTVVIALCSLAFAGIPLVTHARLHRGDRGRRRGLRRGDAAAGDAGRARPAHQLAAGASSARPTPTTRSRTAGGAGPSGSPRGPGARRSPRWSVLVVLALPIFQLELGQNDISALPKDTTSRQAYDGLNKGFGPGVNGPLLIASEFDSPDEAEAGAAEAAESDRRRRRRRRASPNRASTRRARSPSSP